MDYQILGRLQVHDDGRDVALGGEKPRALLAILLLHRNEAVSADRLIDELWGESPPSSAVRTLQAYVSRLRKALGGNGAASGPAGRVLTQGRGYVLRVESGELDLERFSELAERGREALAAGEPGDAAELLREALRLWRGPPLADFAYQPFAQAAIAQLEERRLAAVEERVEADLALGRSRELVGELRDLIERCPLRERVRGQLMVALYRSGRQAEALEVYQEFRRRLSEELGLDPGPGLQRLELAVLARDPTLDLPATQVERLLGGLEIDASSSMSAGLGTELARSRFVGREAELGRLRSWVLAGNRRLIVLEGEPGIGKTRLVGELAKVVARDGIGVLTGRCDEDPLTSYQPFVEALRQHVARVGAAEIAPVAGDELSRLLPELRVAAPVEPEAEAAAGARLRLFEGVVAILEAAARGRRLLLILDDLHWADSSTALLLGYLVRGLRSERVTVVGAYRSAELGNRHPLRGALADLDRDPRMQRLALAGLDTEAIVAILASRIDGEPAPRLVQLVAELTDGNPLFIEEIAQHLLEREALVRCSGRVDLRVHDAEITLPEGVRSVIRGRAERLGDACADVLALASVFGQEFSFPLLEKVSRLERESLLDVCERADAAQLIAPVPARAGRWQFTHALVRAGLYEGLPALRRARVHSRIVDALEESGLAEPSEIAQHAFAAMTVDGPARTVRTSRLAAERALAGLAYEEAAVHYGRALEALAQEDVPPVAERCELLLGLGDAQTRYGDRRAGETFATGLDEARALRDPELAARATLGLCGVGVAIVGLDGNRIRALERALDALGERAPALRARVLARLAIELYYAPGRERSNPLSRQAVRVARAAGDTDALLTALGARHVALWIPDGLEDRLRVADEMIALAREHGRAEQELQGRNWRCADLWESGAIDQFETEIEEHARLATKLRLPSFRWYEPIWRASLAALRGHWEDSQHLAGEAEREGARAGDRNAALFAFGVRLSIRCARREFEEDDLERIDRHVRDSPAGTAWRCLRCWYFAERGRFDDARRELDWLAADKFARLPRDANWFAAMFELTQVVCLFRDASLAGHLYAALLPYRERHMHAMRGCMSFGSARSSLGRLAHALGRHDEAAAHYQAAIHTEKQWGARPSLVHTRFRYADLLAERAQPGDHARASAMTRQAAAEAHALKLVDPALSRP